MDEQIRRKHKTQLPPEQRQAIRDKFKRDTAAWPGISMRLEATRDELARREQDVLDKMMPI